MSCRCDLEEHPAPLVIAAGLSQLPRQIAGFPEFRRALLHSAGSDLHADALGSWQAQSPNDLGVMLLEMWAYLADSLAFYDALHAHECYLRTARREGSVTDLVSRLGYQPKPSTAAFVELALLADGRAPVSVPAGTAFRSSAFGSEPPQVFELDAPLAIHPLRSRWSVAAPRPRTVEAPLGPGTLTSSVWFDPRRSAKWNPGDIALVCIGSSPSDWQAAEVLSSARADDITTEPVSVVTFNAPVALTAGTLIADVHCLRATRSARLWTRTTHVGVASPYLYLSGVFGDLAAGDSVVVRASSAGLEGLACYELVSVYETTISVAVSSTDSAYLPVTVLQLDAAINDASRGANALWSNSTRTQLTVHYGFRDAGALATPATTTLETTDAIVLSSAPAPEADTAATRVFLSDVNGVAQAGYGSMDFATRLFTPASFDLPRVPLTLPVTIFGNVATASRGETVAREILGSGDATHVSQAFELAKSPLTYLVSPSAATGISSTLRVWVDGRAWREAPCFFGSGPDDEVYVVELTDAGKASVLFGDGVLGKRLPTGVDNIVASYRFGAGASLPPARTITQLAKPAPGLSSVVQPLPATGGTDREAASAVRATGPRRALTLGRAVSLQDMAAFAAECAGVRAVNVVWAWAKTAQQPVIRVWVVGGGAEVAVRARLGAVSDPTTPIVVTTATSIPITLDLDIAIDAAVIPSTVLQGVHENLLGDFGSLRVEQLGVGRPVYFSRLLESAHAVAGVNSVKKAWSRGGAVVTGYGDSPGEGSYFSFDSGIRINGEVYGNG